MNRRGFVSCLAGTAGALFVPWRGIVSPTIFLPPQPEYIWVTGLEAIELAIPGDWYGGPGFRINTDELLMLRSNYELCRNAYLKRMEFIKRLTKGRGMPVYVGMPVRRSL